MQIKKKNISDEKMFNFLGCSDNNNVLTYIISYNKKNISVGSMSKATRNNNNIHQNMSLITKLQKTNILLHSDWYGLYINILYIYKSEN